MMCWFRYIIIIISLPFLHCKKDKIPYYWGEVTAKLNGVDWSAKIHVGQNTQNNGLFDVLIDRYNAEGFVREELYIFKIKLEVATQKIYRANANDSNLVAGCNYATVTDDGDVVCDFYDVSASDTSYNSLTITELKTAPRIVKGRFNLRLIVSRLPKCNAAANDTLTFSNGSFLTIY